MIQRSDPHRLTLNGEIIRCSNDDGDEIMDNLVHPTMVCNDIRIKIDIFVR